MRQYEILFIYAYIPTRDIIGEWLDVPPSIAHFIEEKIQRYFTSNMNYIGYLEHYHENN